MVLENKQESRKNVRSSGAGSFFGLLLNLLYVALSDKSSVNDDKERRAPRLEMKKHYCYNGVFHVD